MAAGGNADRSLVSTRASDRSRFHGYVTTGRADDQQLNEPAQRAYAQLKTQLVPELARREAGRAAEHLAGMPSPGGLSDGRPRPPPHSGMIATGVS